MSDFQIDLSNCDREPIHIPGQIQSHGFLVVTDDQMIIRFHSDNISSFVAGITGDLLGQTLNYLESMFGNKSDSQLLTSQVISLRQHSNFEQINPFQISVSGLPYYMMVARSAEYYLLEFEPAAQPDDLEIQGMIGSSVSEMLGDKNLKNLLSNSAKQVKNIIQYDRVMIYRFARDGHGEVVAEAKNEELDPWLGLHYPASDIPKQARELYKLNLIRLIADVNTTPSKILTANPRRPALDLTNSQLRAVSPIHIQYLKNMGVASSFSISLIYKKELWGLIACHNYIPKFINYKSRAAAKLIGQILSSALEFRQDEENQQIQGDFNNSLEKLTKSLSEHENIDEALTRKDATNLLDVVDSTGVVAFYENKTTTLGITPENEAIDKLIQWLKKQTIETVYHTDFLSEVYPEAASYQNIASGILCCALSRDFKEYIIWFKPEQLRTISWAGNPNKPAEIRQNELIQISPRNSFEVWSQTVAGQSESWKSEEIRSVIRLKEEIVYAINQKANAMRMLNEKLRLAYEELDTFSYTISHDLKNPLSIIKSYSQLLKKDQTLSERGHFFLQRIEDKTDKMNLMIKDILEYSRLSTSDLQLQAIPMELMISEIIKDLTLVYDHTMPEITLGETPGLHADPTMIQQIFVNLIGNAVKYSQHSNPPKVHISGMISENEICYTITDNGLGIAEKDLLGIFELFNRMDNVKDIEGSGVGLAIVKRIVEKHHGRIWAKSELNKGSSFFVCFNHPSDN